MSFKLSSEAFQQISAVEGLFLSDQAKEEFKQDELLGLTPQQRRDRIIGKYKQK